MKNVYLGWYDNYFNVVATDDLGIIEQGLCKLCGHHISEFSQFTAVIDYRKQFEAEMRKQMLAYATDVLFISELTTLQLYKIVRCSELDDILERMIPIEYDIHREFGASVYDCVIMMLNKI